jgi:ligand-binding SRPBCC domain-containing protein
MIEVARTTELAAPADAVWDRATTAEGVNHELGPWVRMTIPRAARGKSLVDLEPGRRIGRSWVLLLGVIPFDFDDITLVEVGPGRRFLERSPMGSMRFWQHERLVEERDDRACAVTDRLTFAPRVPGSGRLVRAIVERLFAHRHRRLRAYFAR